MDTITPQDIAGAKRSIIRIFRQHDKSFNIEIIQEYWAMMFLQYQFPDSRRIRQRWFASEVFMNWVSRQFDIRNTELLLQCNFGIHYSKNMPKATFEEFKDVFDTIHARAITRVFPANPIVHEIQKTIC